MVKDQTADDTDACAKQECTGQSPVCQCAEDKICSDCHTVEQHRIDAKSSGAVVCPDLPVLDFGQERLEQSIAESEDQDGRRRRKSQTGRCQGKAGSGCHAAKKQKGAADSQPSGDRGGTESQKYQQGSCHKEESDGGAGGGNRAVENHTLQEGNGVHDP